MKALITLTALIFSLNSFSNVVFPSNIKFDQELKDFIVKSLETKCSIEENAKVMMSGIKVKVDEYDQGKYDTYYYMTFTAQSETTQAYEISLLVEDANIANPRFPRYYLNEISSEINNCKL
ncbi:hypothetical protein OAT67_06185 [Bacteriovoracaceae bacterium]|nr:hypothetical protein [Bacteriovoracaceae bacterium]